MGWKWSHSFDTLCKHILNKVLYWNMSEYSSVSCGQYTVWLFILNILKLNTKMMKYLMNGSKMKITGRCLAFMKKIYSNFKIKKNTRNSFHSLHQPTSNHIAHSINLCWRWHNTFEKWHWRLGRLHCESLRSTGGSCKPHGPGSLDSTVFPLHRGTSCQTFPTLWV